jgi:hypothetical protein
MIDVWNYSSDPSQAYLCHKACGLGRKPLVDEFLAYGELLANRTEDVLLVMIEQGLHTEWIEDALVRSGLMPLVWRPSGTDTPATVGQQFRWPTLQELVDRGQRVLMFNDRATGDELHPVAQPWLQNVWFHFFENSFSIPSEAALACDPHRGSSTNVGVMQNKMSILNHFVSAPVALPAAAAKVNLEASIRKHYVECRSLWSAIAQAPKIPNLVALDFWSIGDPLRTIAMLNENPHAENLLSPSRRRQRWWWW